MSKLITNTIRHTGGSADNITLDNSQNVTVEGNATVDGTSLFTGNVGVGVSAAKKLHVKCSDDMFRLETTDGTGKCTMTFWDPSAQKAYFGYGSGSSDDLYIAQQENANMQLHTNNTERVRIDNTGRTLIGLTSSAASRSSTSTRHPIFQVSSAWSSGRGSASIECTDDYPVLFLNSGAAYSENSGSGVISFSIKDGSGDYCNTASIRAELDGTPGNDDSPGRLEFHTTPDGSAAPTERMRIDSSGNVNINNTGNLDAYRLAGAGSSLRGHLLMGDGRQANTTTQSQLLTLNRLDDDGALITFSQNGNQEGSISVSGSSVSYNGGVLTRWSQLKGISSTDKAARPEIYQGTVMSNLDDLCEWEGEENQQLNMTKVSDVDGDKDIAGVFWAWDDDDDKVVNDFYIAMTGDMVIRVAASTTVARGDLLISAGDGTAKPQADDIVRSSTIAKIISINSTATYADGSKAYPCVLMAC